VVVLRLAKGCLIAGDDYLRVYIRAGSAAPQCRIREIVSNASVMTWVVRELVAIL